MKVVIKRADLSMATSVVHNIVNLQSSLPILSNILIRAEEGKAVFMASDLESNVRCEIPAEVGTPGSVTVPARTFAEMVRVLPDTDIGLELDETRVRVSGEGISYDLVTMDPEDFPAWPEMEPLGVLVLPQKKLHQIIERVLFAIPQKDPRRVLLGGYFDVQGSALKAVATDGKKLSFVQCETESRSGQDNMSAIVPQKILNEVAKTLGDEGDVEILIGERQVVFDLKQIKFVTNIIEGTYPNYELVIPKSFERSMVLPKNALRTLTRQAAIISDEKSNSVILTFDENELSIKAMTYDVGSYAGALKIDYDEDLFEIVFNHRFLGEILDKIEADQVELKVNKPVSPAVFTGKDATDFLFVIMPIKLADLAEPGMEEEE